MSTQHYILQRAVCSEHEYIEYWSVFLNYTQKYITVCVCMCEHKNNKYTVFVNNKYISLREYFSKYISTQNVNVNCAQLRKQILYAQKQTINYGVKVELV